MCPGVTMFAPLKNFGALNGGLEIGIIGFGSLGQWAAKIAKAMGNTGQSFSELFQMKNKQMFKPKLLKI